MHVVFQFCHWSAWFYDVIEEEMTHIYDSFAIKSAYLD